MNVAQIRDRLLPDGYEVLPVEVIRLLVDAGYAAYAPAFGGDEAEVKRVRHAARAADNVLARYEARMAARKTRQPVILLPAIVPRRILAVMAVMVALAALFALVPLP